MKALPQALKLGVGNTGASPARIDQLTLRRVVAEQQRADPMQPRHLRCRNYQPGVLRLKEATIGPVVFKKRKGLQQYSRIRRVQLDTAITAP